MPINGLKVTAERNATFERRRGDPPDVPGSLAMGLRVPAGVVLGIAPWNGLPNPHSVLLRADEVIE